MSEKQDFKDLLDDLSPEELTPRLEMQILVDPIGVLAPTAGNCCRDGGNCQEAFSCDNNCRDGGNCIQEALQPLWRSGE